MKLRWDDIILFINKQQRQNDFLDGFWIKNTYFVRLCIITYVTRWCIAYNLKYIIIVLEWQSYKSCT